MKKLICAAFTIAIMPFVLLGALAALISIGAQVGYGCVETYLGSLGGRS